MRRTVVFLFVLAVLIAPAAAPSASAGVIEEAQQKVQKLGPKCEVLQPTSGGGVQFRPECLW